MRRKIKRTAIIAALALLAGAARLGYASRRPPASPALPFTSDRSGAIAVARPAACDSEVYPREPLQAAIDFAPTGTTVCLVPGVYSGPVVINRRITLWGPAGAVIRSDGKGRTVRAEADGVRVEGFTVDGSGDRYDLTDSGVYVRGAGVQVRGITIRHALYGIVVEKSSGAVLDGNHIAGDKALAIGLRGDAFRIWGTRDSIVSRNLVEDSRDVLVWFSPNMRIEDNVVRRSRYATHFMYANGARVERNRFVSNTVGVFAMYSDNIVIARNLMGGNTASDGFGVGAKESGNLKLVGNRFIRDRVGVYFDECPFHTGQTNTIRGNTFALCETAIASLGSAAHNSFENNTLRDNQAQVRVEESGDMMAATFSGNYFDDYQGYDLDRDGTGDIPYELRSLSDEMIGERPELSFFRGTAALGVIEAMSKVLPLFQARPLMVDNQPRMHPGPESVD